MTEPVAAGPRLSTAARTRAGRWRRLVHARLSRLRRGSLVVEDADGAARFGEISPPEGLQALVRIHDPAAYRTLALGGSVGAGEAYVRGEWSADDLAAALRVVAANPETGRGLDTGLARLARLVHRVRHVVRDNTRRGSRENVAAHYDQGNEVFATFLDPTLQYSSAVFPRPEAGLEEAAVHKLDVVCRKLGLRPGHTLLEIGTGWGGLALHAASRYGCRVVTTTISCQQLATARRRVREAGLADRVEVLDLDYRDLPSLGRRFDRLVSIEMIEAVGARHLDAFFRVCDRVLAPDGRALLQAIVIADQSWSRYRRSVDFIQRYVFPGGCLPSITELCRSATRASSLRLLHLEDLTPHYAQTLAHWRARFDAAAAALSRLGVGEEERRSWDYYFAYCEAGFRERVSALVHMVLAGPEARFSL